MRSYWKDRSYATTDKAISLFSMFSIGDKCAINPMDAFLSSAVLCVV